MTKAQWDALSPQSQWDAYLLLESEAESYEAQLATLKAMETPFRLTKASEQEDDTIHFSQDELDAMRLHGRSGD